MDCRALFNMIPQVHLRHAFKESNMAADTMAKKGIRLLLLLSCIIVMWMLNFYVLLMLLGLAIPGLDVGSLV
ncbi:hypothetical protein SLA2020_313690 [Shorea laevis]